MFYHQAMLFLTYLKQTDRDAFSRLLLSVEDGRSFAKAFKSAYPIGLDQLWKRFLAQLAAPG